MAVEDMFAIGETARSVGQTGDLGFAMPDPDQFRHRVIQSHLPAQQRQEGVGMAQPPATDLGEAQSLEMQMRQAGVMDDWRTGPLGYVVSATTAMGAGIAKGVASIADDLGMWTGESNQKFQEALGGNIESHQMQAQANVQRAMESSGWVGRIGVQTAQAAVDVALFLGMMKAVGAAKVLGMGAKAAGSKTAMGLVSGTALKTAGKRAAFSFVTNPGFGETEEERWEDRRRGAAVTFAYMATPGLSGWAKTPITAKAFDFLLNSGISLTSGQYSEAVNAGIAESIADGNEEQWMGYVLGNLIPIVGTDAAFSAMTKSLGQTMKQAYSGVGQIGPGGKSAENIIQRFFEERQGEGKPVPQGWEQMPLDRQLAEYKNYFTEGTRESGLVQKEEAATAEQTRVAAETAAAKQEQELQARTDELRTPEYGRKLFVDQDKAEVKLTRDELGKEGFEDLRKSWVAGVAQNEMDRLVSFEAQYGKELTDTQRISYLRDTMRAEGLPDKVRKEVLEVLFPKTEAGKTTETPEERFKRVAGIKEQAETKATEVIEKWEADQVLPPERELGEGAFAEPKVIDAEILYEPQRMDGEQQAAWRMATERLTALKTPPKMLTEGVVRDEAVKAGLDEPNTQEMVDRLLGWQREQAALPERMAPEERVVDQKEPVGEPQEGLSRIDESQRPEGTGERQSEGERPADTAPESAEAPQRSEVRSLIEQKQKGVSVKASIKEMMDATGKTRAEVVAKFDALVGTLMTKDSRGQYSIVKRQASQGAVNKGDIFIEPSISKNATINDFMTGDVGRAEARALREKAVEEGTVIKTKGRGDSFVYTWAGNEQARGQREGERLYGTRNVIETIGDRFKDERGREMVKIAKYQTKDGVLVGERKEETVLASSIDTSQPGAKGAGGFIKLVEMPKAKAIGKTVSIGEDIDNASLDEKGPKAIGPKTFGHTRKPDDFAAGSTPQERLSELELREKGKTVSIMDYAKTRGLKRGDAVAELKAMEKSGLAEPVGPGKYRFGLNDAEKQELSDLRKELGDDTRFQTAETKKVTEDDLVKKGGRYYPKNADGEADTMESAIYKEQINGREVFITSTDWGGGLGKVWHEYGINLVKAYNAMPEVSGFSRSELIEQMKADFDTRFQTAGREEGPVTRAEVTRQVEDMARKVKGTFTADRTDSNVVGTLRQGPMRIMVINDKYSDEAAGAIKRLHKGKFDYLMFVDPESGMRTTVNHEMGHVLRDVLNKRERELLAKIGYEVDSKKGDERFAQAMETTEGRNEIAQKLKNAAPAEQNVILRGINRVVDFINSVFGTDVKHFGSAREFEQLAGGIREFGLLREIGERAAAARAETGEREQMAGRGAKTANVGMADKAEELEKDRIRPDMRPAQRDVEYARIAKETGWHKVVDGEKWMFEIDDSKIQLLDAEWRDNADWVRNKTLDKIISHPELFASYPSLKSLRIGFNISGEGGSYGGNTIWLGKNVVGRGSQAALKKLLAHEIQHAIQEIEGFKRGGSAIGERSRIADETRPSPDLRMGDTGYDLEAARDRNRMIASEGDRAYRTLTGEAIARVAARRMDMTPDQRKAETPRETLVKMLTKEGLLKEGQRPEDVLINRGGTGIQESSDTRLQKSAKKLKDSDIEKILVDRYGRGNIRAAWRASGEAEYLKWRKAEAQRFMDSKPQGDPKVQAKIKEGMAAFKAPKMDKFGRPQQQSKVARWFSETVTEALRPWAVADDLGIRDDILETSMRGTDAAGRVNHNYRQWAVRNEKLADTIYNGDRVSFKVKVGGDLEKDGARDTNLSMTRGEALEYYALLKRAKTEGETGHEGTAVRLDHAMNRFVMEDSVGGNKEKVYHITKEQREAFMAAMEKDKTFVKGVDAVEELMEMTYDAIAPQYKEIHGVDLKRDEFYYHMVRDISFVKDKAKGKDKERVDNVFNLFNKGQTILGINPENLGSLKKVQWSDAPIIIRDAWDSVKMHEKNVERYLEASPMKDWVDRNLMNDDIAMNLQQTRKGKAVYKYFKDISDSIGGQVHKEQRSVERALTAFLRKATPVRLANPFVWLKQPMSLPSASAYLGVDALPSMYGRVDKAFVDRVRGYSGTLLGRAAGRSYDPLLPEYHGKGAGADIHKNYGSVLKGASARSANFTTKMMGSMDKVAIDRIIMGAKHFVEKNSPNLKGDAFEKEVARHAALATKMTQVATFSIDRTMMERSVQDPIRGMLTYMWGARGAQFNLLAHSLSKGFVDKTPESLRMAGMVWLTAGLAQSSQIVLADMIRDSAGKDPDDDDTNKAYEFGLGVFESIAGTVPLLGTEALPAIMNPIYKAAGLDRQAALRAYRIGRTGPVSGATIDVMNMASAAGSFLSLADRLERATTTKERDRIEASMSGSFKRGRKSLIRLGSEMLGIPVNQVTRWIPEGD